MYKKAETADAVNASIANLLGTSFLLSMQNLLVNRTSAFKHQEYLLYCGKIP